MIFDSAREKLGRAEQHLGELHAAEKRFLETEPYEVVAAEVEANGLEHVYRLKVRAEPIPELSALLGDAVHNIRSSLDHVVYAVACHQAPGLTDKQKRGLQFPVCGTSPDFQKKVNDGRLRGIKDLAPFEALQPYNGGPTWLPVVTALDNIDKHRRLAILASATERGQINPPNQVDHTVWRRESLEDGAEVVRLVFTTKPQVDMSVSASLRIAVEPINSSDPALLPHEVIQAGAADIRDLIWRLRGKV